MRDDVTEYLARVVKASMTRQRGGGYNLQAVALFGPRDILAGAVYEAEEQLLLLAGDAFFFSFFLLFLFFPV